MTKYRTIVADPPWPIGDFPKWGDEDGVTPRPYAVRLLSQLRSRRDHATPTQEVKDVDEEL